MQTMTAFELASGGSFQPLSWHKKQGYDVSLIQQGCVMRTHPVLGPTYLLSLDAETAKKTWAGVDQKLVQLESALKKRKLGLPEAEDDPDLESEDEKRAGRPGKLPTFTKKMRLPNFKVFRFWEAF